MRTPGIEPAHLRSVAETVATEAATFVRRRRAEVFGDDGDAGNSSAVRTKSTRTDPVTVVDTETERLLRDRLEELRPGDPVLGEEGGGPQSATADPGTVTWVVDPVDGTVNFVYGIPAYAVSVAAQVDGVSVAGAVADVVAGQVYSAARGHCSAMLSTSCRWPWWAPASPTHSAVAPARRRCWRASCPKCAMSAASGPRRSICAWWGPAGWTATSSTACTCGTVLRARWSPPRQEPVWCCRPQRIKVPAAWWWQRRRELPPSWWPLWHASAVR